MEKKGGPEIPKDRREILEAQVRTGQEAAKFLDYLQKDEGKYFNHLLARIEDELVNILLTLPPEAKDGFSLVQARRFQNYEPIRWINRDIEMARMASSELRGERGEGGLL